MSDKITQILSVFMALAFMLMMAPNVIAMNKGKALRNIAIWMALFAGLGLIYKTFGPEGQIQLIHSNNIAIQQQSQPKHENEPKSGRKPADSDEIPGSLPKLDEKSL